MRKCEPDDLPRVLRFYQHVIEETDDMARFGRWVWGQHPTEAMVAAYLHDGNMYVLEEAGEIVAAVAVTPCQTADYHDVDWQLDAADDAVAVVHILAVDPRRQKQGLAGKIMGEIMDRAKADGKKAVRLDALACNIHAHKLYTSLGFAKRGVCRWYADNTGWTDFYLFEYLLES